MTKLLVSVTNMHEAEMAISGGADIIDIKNPAAGALGALPLEETRHIVQGIHGRKLVSATIGDIAMDANRLMSEIERTLATDVDIVKIGIFDADQHSGCIEVEAIRAETLKGINIVAVLFADQQPDFKVISQLEKAGFFGVMLDTSQKDGNNLLDYISLVALQRFINDAKLSKLRVGLAGSLKLEHIQTLTSLEPDYLGFRGALCEKSHRQNPLNMNHLHRARLLLCKNNNDSQNLPLLPV